MKRKTPPRIKIYEALGCVADQRIAVEKNRATVRSSSGNKYYTVTFDPEKMAIMSNDNWSYRQGYLGYPSIAYLMLSGYLDYESVYGNALRWIARKDINTHHKNDYSATMKGVDIVLEEKWVNMRDFKDYQERIEMSIETLKLSLLWKKTKPPTAY